MRQHLTALVFVLAVCFGVRAHGESSWIFQPSHYSHDSQSGDRVEQYALKPPAYAPNDPTYQQSAYLHKRTALRGVGGSVERRHYVETWGAGEAIRPYGEWQRPFRAGATPYGPWGNANGPWTTPYDSWRNPYGLGKLPTPPWSPWSPMYPHGGAGYPPYQSGPPVAVPYGQGGHGGQAAHTGGQGTAHSPTPTAPGP